MGRKLVAGEASAAAAKGTVAPRDVRRKHVAAVGHVLAPLLAPALARQGVALAQLLPHWHAICPLLAPYSLPESLKNDVLTVAVASDAVKQELLYITPQIVESVNTLLGYEAVSKVRGITRHDVGQQKVGPGVRAASAPINGALRDKVRAVCESIKDEDLRQALQRLGSVLSKTK